jgi:hypothetical protein
LFAVEGVTYSWDDVLAWAAARGALEGLQRSSQEGLARARHAHERGGGVAQEAVSAAATRFRYQRRLLSAEELAAWFSRWGITVAEWGEYLERSILLETPHAEADTAEIDDAALAEAEFVDGVCSGFLELQAHAFAADTALADLTPVEVAGDRATMVERMLDAAALARDSAASEEGIDREIAKRGLDWTRLELDVLELDDEGAAREAALCIRVDGRAIADVAADCGAEVDRLDVYLADLEPWLQAPLLAAQRGELVGPIEEDGIFILLSVTERAPGTPTDLELRRRAEASLVERAVKRATEGRVEWIDDI